MPVDPLRSLVRAGYDQAASAFLTIRVRDGTDAAQLDDLIARLDPDSSVLDAGCGSGVPISQRLLAEGHRVVGLDSSGGQLTLARSLIDRFPVVQGDLSCLPFTDETFDSVVSYYAVIHVARDEHPLVVEEFHRVLRAEGTLLLCMGWTDLPEDNDPVSWLGVPMYWSHFDAATNRDMVEQAEFRIEWGREVQDPNGHGSHQFILAIKA